MTAPRSFPRVQTDEVAKDLPHPRAHHGTLGEAHSSLELGNIVIPSLWFSLLSFLSLNPVSPSPAPNALSIILEHMLGVKLLKMCITVSKML